MSLGALEVDALAERLRRHEPSVAGDPDAIRVVRAPGRVNLIGEHTDYNLGFVLPAAIGLEIRLAFVPTSDRRVAITLPDGERREFDLDAIPPRSGGWIDYVAATAWSLQSAGLPLHGFRGVLASDLPMSAGLSSSAALELASAWALLDPPDLETHGIDGMQLARLCQRGENDHVGVQCGIMDQAAVTLGQPGRALLLDCRSLDVRPVALPTNDHVLVVCDTNAPRRLEASEYNVRRAECESAVAAIAEAEPGVESLRDVDAEMLARHAPRLRPVELARAEHVIGENARVLRDGRSAGDRQSRRRRPAVRREPRLAARPVRGELPRAGCHGRDRDRDPGRRGGADDRGRVRWLYGEPRAARRFRRVPGCGRARVPGTNRPPAAGPRGRTRRRSRPGGFRIGGSLECAASRQWRSGG